MSAKQHPERGITMEMNKVTMSDMLLTYINYGQKGCSHLVAFGIEPFIPA